MPLWFKKQRNVHAALKFFMDKEIKDPKVIRKSHQAILFELGRYLMIIITKDQIDFKFLCQLKESLQEKLQMEVGVRCSLSAGQYTSSLDWQDNGCFGGFRVLVRKPSLLNQALFSVSILKMNLKEKKFSNDFKW